MQAGGVGDMLTDLDRAILDLESESWRLRARKEQAIEVRLGIKPTAYYQRLAALLDEPDAWAYAPAVVKRLRARRSGPRLG